MSRSPSVLRAVGSLWFAAVLLVLWLVAMACATVVESSHDTERALTQFYQSWWFESLLALLAVNVLSAVLLRSPFGKRQIGFALTHIGILVTLGGAVVTKQWAVNGQVGLAEQQSAGSFRTDRSALTVMNRRDLTRADMDLDAPGFDRLETLDRPEAPALTSGDLRVEVQRYIPDGRFVQQVTDDGPGPRPAVEVALSADGMQTPKWLFADDTAEVGAIATTYRVVTNAAELAELLNPPPQKQGPQRAMIRVEHQDSTFEFGIEDCSEDAVPLGDTGYAVRVLRYLPHATVGPDNTVINASERPVNPAVEVELTSPAGRETRLAFARFPDFRSMHGDAQIEGLEVTFIAPQDTSPKTPLQIIGAPDGRLFARFDAKDRDAVVRSVSVGRPTETPWPGTKLTVLRQFNNARADWTMEPIEPPRKGRTPALLLGLSTPEHSSSMWVLKYRARSVDVDGVPYEILYGDETLPLGFTLALNRFHIGQYPGTSRPRSFESHVTITDPNTGRQLNRVIGMNNPAKYAGYSLFQSRYDLAGGQRVSYLSVARDPGLPIVFAGYIATLAGMVVVLVTRMVDRRRTVRSTPAELQTTAVSSDRDLERSTPADLEAVPRVEQPGLGLCLRWSR
ncbi:MAG TPA: cytochrome c biogenesis protein ResB [Phycisphaerae bacterium]|nr:cytochrome c biogenesis protein ResB [Phycisphaerae bacterium]